MAKKTETGASKGFLVPNSTNDKKMIYGISSVLKFFAVQKKLKNMKMKAIEWEKIFIKHIYLSKDLYPEYIKCSYN